MKYAISILRRRGALIAAVLAAIVLTVTAGAAFADYTSTFSSADNVLRIDDLLPAPKLGPAKAYTTDLGGLHALVSGDTAPLSKDHFSPAWVGSGFTGINGLTVTAKAAPGGDGKNAYVDGGFLTNEDIFFIGQHFTDLVSLDLSSATAGALSGDNTWLGDLGTLFKSSSAIQSIKLPKGLKTISADAFKNVDIKLTEIVFNEDLEKIGGNAFAGAIHSNGAVIAFTGDIPPSFTASAFGSLSGLTFVAPKNSGYDALFSSGALTGQTPVHVTVTAPRFGKVTFGKTASKPVSVDYDGVTAVSFNMTVDSDKFKIVKSADNTAVNGKTNAEWQIGPSANIPVGHHEDKIKVAFSNGALAYAVVSADVIEAAPAVTLANIDYAAERLTGFTAAASYDITYGAAKAQYKADSNGYIPVNEGWFGRTIYMVKVNADESLNSDEAQLPLPKRPDVPSAAIVTQASSATAKDGGLTVTSQFPAEYRRQGDANWTSVSSDNKVSNLAAGTYEVRVKGDNGSSRFPSRGITAVVTVKGSPSPNLNVAALDFAPKVTGYGDITPLNLIISNNGDAKAVITGVVSDSTDFTVSAGSADVTAGGQNTSWTVKPITGLAAGEHRTNISVNYNYGKVSAGDVSFMVYAAPKIESFSIDIGGKERSGVIDEKSHTITVTVPHGSDLTKLVPTITFIGESVTPESGAARDFTSAVTYTVKAYGKETAYTVKVNADIKQAGTLVDVNYRSWKASASKGNDGRYTFEIDIPLASGLDASKINPGSLTVNGMTALAEGDVVFDEISLNANLRRIFIFGTASDLSLVKLSSLSYKLLGDDVTVYTQTFDRDIPFNDIPKKKHNRGGGCDAGSSAAAIALACAALAIRGRRG